MKQPKTANCSTCKQEFESKPIYEESDTDGVKGTFEGYMNDCGSCRTNPYVHVKPEILNEVMMYCDGISTKADLIAALDRIKS